MTYGATTSNHSDPAHTRSILSSVFCCARLPSSMAHSSGYFVLFPTHKIPVNVSRRKISPRFRHSHYDLIYLPVTELPLFSIKRRKAQETCTIPAGTPTSQPATTSAMPYRPTTLQKRPSKRFLPLSSASRSKNSHRC